MGLGGDIVHTDHTYTNPGFSDRTRTSYEIGISPGLYYFISPRWIVTGQFGALLYQSIVNYLTEAETYIGFNFSTNTAGIGIRYVLLPRQKKTD